MHRKPRQHRAHLGTVGFAALILYLPANVYPVLTVIQLGADQPSTILGGVRELIDAGMWPLALLVFFASIAVPVLKLISLGVLLITTQSRSRWRLRDRTMLYRVVEGIGRWSMIDVFMDLHPGGAGAVRRAGDGRSGAGRDRVRRRGDPDHVRRGELRSAPDVGRGGMQRSPDQRSPNRQSRSRTIPQRPIPRGGIPSRRVHARIVEPFLDLGDPRGHLADRRLARLGHAGAARPADHHHLRGAEGLQAGQSHVRHKDVDMGLVESIALSKDLQRVVVKVRMTRCRPSRC